MRARRTRLLIRSLRRSDGGSTEVKRILALVITVLIVALIVALQRAEDAELLAAERRLVANDLRRDLRRMRERMQLRGVA